MDGLYETELRPSRAMSKRISRNAPCPCGSGKKYKHCCIRKDFDWVEMDDGRVGRQVPLSDEVLDVLEGLRRSQISRYGREQDRIFEGAPPLEILEHWTVEAMKKAAVEPALIYAFEKTNGLLLNEHNENKVPDTDIAEWEAAIDQYESETGNKATRRRLNDQDFDAIFQNSPAERSSRDGFVDRLPFPPPFAKEEWGERQMSDIIEGPDCFSYFQRCLTEITRSGRAEVYLNMFTVMAHAGPPGRQVRDYSALLDESHGKPLTSEQLRTGLESVLASCGPQGAMPNSVAAFEFLGFIGDFMISYVEHAGLQDELADILQKINALALLAFTAAVNAELGIRRDIWTT